MEGKPESNKKNQEFCVRWNSHLGSLGEAFPHLLNHQRFVDCSLVCEGTSLHCHRLVLAACSSFFESIFAENPTQHPVIILPRDVKLWQIQALIDFMYKGEVLVTQQGLTDLLICAESLQIRGLVGSEAALNLNTAQVQKASSNIQNIHGNSTSSKINLQKVEKKEENTELDIDESSSSTSSQEDYEEKISENSSKDVSSYSANKTSSTIMSSLIPSDAFHLNNKKNTEISDSLPKHESFLSMDDSLDSNDESSVQLDKNHSNYKRIRRSEALLTQAAKCVSKGQTFQTVSNMFNIPVSTIRFFMARKGILPKRKRGRSSGGSFGIIFKDN